MNWSAAKFNFYLTVGAGTRMKHIFKRHFYIFLRFFIPEWWYLKIEYEVTQIGSIPGYRSIYC